MSTAPESDPVLLAAFEDGSLPVEQWTHRSHVRVACLYAMRDAFDAATDRMRRGLQSYNAATDTPETVDRGYHETITQAFMRLICAAVEHDGPYISSNAFCEAHPELLTPSALHPYYTQKLLRTLEAKSTFVAPDRQPLPVANAATRAVHRQEFLASTEIVDWHDSAIRTLAEQLRGSATDDVDVARRTFEWVRDHIRHSVDHGCRHVTCHASEVLTRRTGFCYAKSHLLAALLRAQGIPTGFCYQRLSVEDSGPPYCLHGLNAVFLPARGWYRADCRGNKPGVDAQFTPPREKLAFAVTESEEFHDPMIYPEPLPDVVHALQTTPTVQELMSRLPDTTATVPVQGIN